MVLYGACTLEKGGPPTEVLVCEKMPGIDLLIGANLHKKSFVLDFTNCEMGLGDKTYSIKTNPDLDFAPCPICLTQIALY